MGFFGHGSDDQAGADDEAGRRPDRSPVFADVPSVAEQRLAQLVGSELFTSTLGVGEFALLSMLGPAPIAQVMGASVHQVGWLATPTPVLDLNDR